MQPVWSDRHATTYRIVLMVLYHWFSFLLYRNYELQAPYLYRLYVLVLVRSGYIIDFGFYPLCWSWHWYQPLSSLCLLLDELLMYRSWYRYDLQFNIQHHLILEILMNFLWLKSFCGCNSPSTSFDHLFFTSYSYYWLDYENLNIQEDLIGCKNDK